MPAVAMPAATHRVRRYVIERIGPFLTYGAGEPL
jgi:hypothetical protein